MGNARYSDELNRADYEMGLRYLTAARASIAVQLPMFPAAGPMNELI
jgi:hypothetical protein